MVLVEDGTHVALIVFDLNVIDAVLPEAVAHHYALNGTVAVGVIAAIVAGHDYLLQIHVYRVYSREHILSYASAIHTILIPIQTGRPQWTYRPTRSDKGVQQVDLICHIELASVGGVGDIGDVPVAVDDFLWQIENIVFYQLYTFVQVFGHVAVGVPCVLHLLVRPVLEVHRAGVGQLLALVGDLFQLVSVTGYREVVYQAIVIEFVVARAILPASPVSLQRRDVAVQVVAVAGGVILLIV